jgi:hypothetical protein
MPSPFPGMNPYLEHPNGWAGFHNRMIAAYADALTPQVVPRYYVYLSDATDPGDGGKLFSYPDIGIGPDRGGTVATAGTLTVTAPARVTVPPPVELLRMSYMEIRDADSEELVTVIELLSPSNKVGDDSRAYLHKWQAFMESRVHFVEIDLLRGGRPTPWGHRPPSDYSVTVSRWEARPTADRWPIRLRDRLPVIPVPLRDGDPEATLDLQALLHRVYDAAGYQYRVYRRPPEPPLAPPDDGWAADLARSATPG